MWYWFVYIRETLNPWHKSHLIITCVYDVHDAFSMLCIQFAVILLRIFVSIFISDIGL